MRAVQNGASQLPPVIIPAYQPGEKFYSIVEQLLQEGFTQILIVNDGSDEEHSAGIKKAAELPQVTLLEHAVNLGKGAALKTAFNYLLLQSPHCIGAVTVDADGQHLPQDAMKVAHELQANPQSLVLGVRGFEKDVPLRSKFGNFVTIGVFHLLVGKRVSDTQTGLRGIPLELMRRMLSYTSTRYEFELDMLLAASHGDYEMREVPITTVYEAGNTSSHFNPFLDSFRIYFVFLRFSFTSLATYCTDLLIFTLTYQMGHQMFFSIVSGRASGALVSVLGSRNFVFKSQKNLLELTLKFLLLWLVLLGLSYSLMLFFVNVWKFNIYVSRITVDSVLFLFNFLVQRDLIFGDGYKILQKIIPKRDHE